MLESRTSFKENNKVDECGLQSVGDTSSDTADKVQPSVENDAVDTIRYITGYKLLVALAALNLSAVLINLDSSILSTVTPTITDEFHSVKDIGWYVSSYQLAVSALQPLTGKFFTYFSNKWTYIAFLIVFEVGSLICGLASSSPMFIAGRAISGAGGAGLFNGSMIIVYAMLPPEKRPTMMGVMLAISQLGLIGGPLIGGLLTQYSTWRWCFWINLPIGGVACVLLALVHIPEQMPKPGLLSVVKDRDILKKFDVVGSTILVGAVVQLLLGLQFGGSDYPWKSATVIGLLSGFGGATLLFVGWEYRAGANALIPLEIISNRVVACGSMMNLCMFGATYISTYFIPIFFQSILGDSPMESGIHMLPSILGSILLTMLSGILVSKTGCHLPWAVLAAILATIGTSLMSTWSPNVSVGKWIGYQIIYGSGRGLGFQMAIVAIQTALPPAQVATALTLLVFVQGLGAAVLISVGNTVFTSTIMGQIRLNAPNVDAHAVIAAGATAFRDSVSSEDLLNVVKAWAVGFQRTMYVAAGLSGGMFLFSWGLGLGDLRKKDARQPGSSRDGGKDS